MGSMNKPAGSPNVTNTDSDTALDLVMREDELKTFLLAQYGPLLTRDDLVKVLGFPSGAAFDRYWQRGRLELNLARPPKRRGVFALASDVARYLVRLPRDNAGYQHGGKASSEN